MTTTTDSPSVLDADPLAGTAYRVVRRIGAGAMGEVFEAEHIPLRRRLAVKLLSPKLASDPAFVDRLRLEAQALASVRHANVVAVHDHATTPAGTPFLAMELLHGRTLHQLLRERGSLPLAEALCLLDEVFAGLMAIHSAGLAHRDLKPANIFLCEEAGRRSVKLLDFGLVKVIAGRSSKAIAPLRFPTQEGQLLGTPRYMAPEQILEGACDARTDVYAAGVLLFTVLAGRDPFHAHRTDLEILTAHLSEDPPLLSRVASQHVPPALDGVIARALAKSPGARFASIADFAAALNASLNGGDRVPFRPRAVTEKIPLAMFRSGPAGTAPIEAALFRPRRSVLPFTSAKDDKAVEAPASPAPPTSRAVSAEGAARQVPPTFGLPPALPAAKEKPHASQKRPARTAPSGADRGPIRRLLPAAALLCGLLALVLWRFL